MPTWRMCRHVQEVVTKAATDALRSLQQRRLITWEQKAGLWGPTLLGSAVVASGLNIQDSLDYKQVCAFFLPGHVVSLQGSKKIHTTEMVMGERERPRSGVWRAPAPPELYCALSSTQ